MSRRPKNKGVGADTWIRDQYRGEGRRTADRRENKHRRQRAEQGYSWYDWISFDTFLAGVIANAVRDFRLNGVGFPLGMTIEEWNDILTRIEEPLRKWSEDKFEMTTDGELSVYKQCQESLRLFADHFGSMWD